RLRRHAGQWVIQLVLLMLAFITFVPLVTLLSLSVKDIYQFNVAPMGITFPMRFENYALAWKFMRDPIWHNILIATVATLASLSMASISAFVFARFRFPGRDVLFFAIVILLFIPNTVLLVPTYQLIISFSLQNTLWALILPYCALQALAIVVLRTFFLEMPDELFDAAIVDGASVVQQFTAIAAPLAKPVISAMAIFQVWLIWNDYAWPSLVANAPQARTAALALIVFNDFTMPEPGAGMAAGVLAALPMLVLFFATMRTFIAGLTAGAVKG
ncbi:carbohydrate ABC transporter permease, partial [Caldilinea sp.]|uniref:carbohydrate ABC transporter permease n=1 Tax=Caldilinea sp. TaxID=2293560 RepID=UPI002CB04BE7|nr:carbohydrate ABC transporter permease [Caldilinea sp.]